MTRKGGVIAPEDPQAELYFPPNTLAQDTIVTVNSLTETEVERRGSGHRSVHCDGDGGRREAR